MYFKRSKEKELSRALFENPTSEYRAQPFWAWNSRLDFEELSRQIKIFKEMGFGGFNMHVRQGLEDEYLGDSYLAAMRHSAECAEREGMLAWAYDEDRWPSGAAGGIVTKNPAFRQKFLNMCFSDKECAESKDEAAKSGKPYFLAAFSLDFDEKGIMRSYKRVERSAPCENKRYFFLEQRQGGEPRYNGGAYVDTLDKKAIDEFISVTHEKIKSALGDKFGTSVPSIFTDEPQLYGTWAPKSAYHKNDVGYSFTSDFDETYKAKDGEDILDFLPELFYATADSAAYKTRYNYYTHLSDRFSEAYLDNIGDWCEKNGIALSGHVLGEDALWETVLDNADNMRTYYKMHYPGIDILCDDVVYNTPIQCRSVVRQLGKEAMLSEMYGITGWDFDFRGHKFQGDWQAALGVNVRVPHLAWQSMKGEGKRDYPAPISYQSPWHLEYKYIEDYFARINTALVRGEPLVNIAVVYPIDTYKMIYASMAETKDLREEIDNNYRETTRWLLSRGYDFDFLSESLLPKLCEKGTYPLKLGKMEYTTLIISDCMTLRAHTVKIIEEFKAAGGKVIVMGRAPEFVDAVPNTLAKKVSKGASVIPHSKRELFRALSEEPIASVKLDSGEAYEGLITTARRDGEALWLFFAHQDKPALMHETNGEKLVISVNGGYRVTFYDTLSGEILPIDYENDGKTTKIYKELYSQDTLLLRLDREEGESSYKAPKAPETAPLEFEFSGEYELSEPNVLLLDMARFSIDGAPLSEKREEIMRIDGIARATLGLPLRKFKVIQPWAAPKCENTHKIKLVYSFKSELEISGAALATEHPETLSVSLNGLPVSNVPSGFYVDRDIKTLVLPKIKKGENELVIEMPFGERVDLEASYIIGDFGVRVSGDSAELIKRPEKLFFGDVATQGFSFYGGNISYTGSVFLENDGDITLSVPHYRGALVGVSVDGERVGRIAFSPYTLDVKKLKKGKHKITFTLFGTRYNTFSSLHNLNADKKRVYIGPDFWRAEGNAFSYEYASIRPLGILSSPKAFFAKKAYSQRP